MSSVGKQLPLYCTGLGRALLAYKSEEEIRSLFPEVLTAYTPHTIATINDLLKELELTRQRGYAVEHEETNLMVNCIAVSLDYNNAPIAALSISIPTFRISESKEKKLSRFFGKPNSVLRHILKCMALILEIKKYLTESLLAFCQVFLYAPFPSPAKYSFTSFTTTPDNRKTAIKFGIAISPLNVSAIFHISPRSIVAPTIATSEYSTINGLLIFVPNKNSIHLVP